MVHRHRPDEALESLLDSDDSSGMHIDGYYDRRAHLPKPTEQELDAEDEYQERKASDEAYYSQWTDD